MEDPAKVGGEERREEGINLRVVGATRISLFFKRVPLFPLALLQQSASLVDSNKR